MRSPSRCGKSHRSAHPKGAWGGAPWQPYRWKPSSLGDTVNRNTTGTGVALMETLLALLALLWAAVDISSLDANFQNIRLEISFSDWKYNTVFSHDPGARDSWGQLKTAWRQEPPSPIRTSQFLTVTHTDVAVPDCVNHRKCSVRISPENRQRVSLNAKSALNVSFLMCTLQCLLILTWWTGNVPHKQWVHQSLQLVLDSITL